MPITKADLLDALGQLTADDAAKVGLVKTIDSPFRPPQSTPDRVKRVDGAVRWYQLQVVDWIAELHTSELGTVIHRYRRQSSPPAPRYLLDGFVGVDTLDASDLTTANDPAIWIELARVAPDGGGRTVLRRYG
jgi:hypothetical protein